MQPVIKCCCVFLLCFVLDANAFERDKSRIFRTAFLTHDGSAFHLSVEPLEVYYVSAQIPNQQSGGSGERRSPMDRSKQQRPAAPRAQTQRRLKQQRRRSNKRRGGGSGAVRGAQTTLRRFRQASMLAVVLTSLILLTLAAGDTESMAQNTGNIPDTVAIIETIDTESLVQQAQRGDTAAAERVMGDPTDEALGTLRSLWEGFFESLPKLAFAILAVALAWVFIRFIKWVLRKSIGKWRTADAIITIVSIAMWLFAVAIALSIVAGDIRALVGSVGLIGLALSWALQSPIESFTAWLLNSFRHYYRIGDRIAVGDILGDVYKIDFLTTTVWEIGSPFRGTFVQAEQATGRMVTFPNNEILSGTIVNYTRDFPFVWDELAVQVANESDVNYTIDVLLRVANGLLLDYMREPAAQYEAILQVKGLAREVPDKPQIFLASADSWTDYIIRYLVGAQERRIWKSELTRLLTIELNKPEHQGKIISVYPRRQIQFFTADGNPSDVIPK